MRSSAAGTGSTPCVGQSGVGHADRPTAPSLVSATCASDAGVDAGHGTAGRGPCDRAGCWTGSGASTRSCGRRRRGRSAGGGRAVAASAGRRGRAATLAEARPPTRLAGGEERPQQPRWPGRGRGARTGTPPGGPGRDRDREVPGLPGARRAVAARRSWWPRPPRRSRTSWPRRTCPWSAGGLGTPVLLRRAEGPQQLPLPPAGGRGRARRAPAVELAERGRRGRRDGVDAAADAATSRGERAPRAWSTRCATPPRLGGDDPDRRPGRPALRAAARGPGPW